MNTIYKYPINLQESQTVNLPYSAKILTAQFQSGRLCIWAEVDTDKKPQPRRILVYGTGHEVQAVNKQYIATALKDGFVWHIFENYVH